MQSKAVLDFELRGAHALALASPPRGRHCCLGLRRTLSSWLLARVAGAVGDSGVGRVRVASVLVRRGSGGPLVTVELEAGTPMGLLRLLGIVPPRMVGGATATARVVAA